MADTIALKLTGVVQGEIKGDNPNTTLGRENTIEVLSFSQSMRLAFDRASGLATGKRFYEPIKFTKRIDRTSPMLRKALFTNESLSGKFLWFREESGDTAKFFEISFTDGRISGVTARMPDVLDAVGATLPPFDEVEMIFNTISWTFTTGSITAEDSWTSTR
jgi:type VI secretion system Hcp family effector